MKYDLPNCLSPINRIVLYCEKYWEWRQITQAWSYILRRACEGVEKEETEHTWQAVLLWQNGCKVLIDCGVFVLSASFLWFMEGSWRNEQQFRVHYWIWQHKTIIGRNDKKAIRSFQCFSFLVCVCVCAHTCLFVFERRGAVSIGVVFVSNREVYIQNSCNTWKMHGTDNFSGVNQENKGAFL